MVLLDLQGANPNPDDRLRVILQDIYFIKPCIVLVLLTRQDPLNAEGNPNPTLQLQDCRITNAVKCLPPANKPTPAEIRQCNAYSADELHSLTPGTAVLALGQIAHQAVLRASGIKTKCLPLCTWCTLCTRRARQPPRFTALE